MDFLTREAARQIDERAVSEFGMPSLLLMENAGRGLADKLIELGLSGTAVICCGKGNNGGDGFVLARHLDLRCLPARVLLWSEPEQLTGDAATNFQILAKTGVPIDVFSDRRDPARLAQLVADANWIVDALLGTGSRGEPRPPLDEVIGTLNAAGRPILAVDLPSGLDCDTGVAARHTICAAHTCTFVAPKVGFTTASAAAYLGKVHVLDIGAPRVLVESVLKEHSS